MNKVLKHVLIGVLIVVLLPSVVSAATITAGVNNPDFANYIYSVELIDPSGQSRTGQFIISNATNPSVFNYTLDVAGVWTVDVYKWDSSMNFVRVITSSVISIVTPEAPTSLRFSSDITNTNPIDIARQKDTVYLTAKVENLDLTHYSYPIKITDSSGVLIENLPVITTPQTYTIYVNPLAYDLTGNYLVTLYQYGYDTGTYTVLRTTNITVSLPSNSSIPAAGLLIFSTGQYPMGAQINISFMLINPDFGTYSYYMALYDGNNFLEDTQPIYAGQLNGYWEPNHVKTVVQMYEAQLIQKRLSDYATVVLYDVSTSYGNVVTVPTGNLLTPKATYNQSETIPISYNTSVNGRLRIGRVGAYASYNVVAGSNQLKNYYIPSSATLGAWTIQLQYTTDGSNWYNIDSTDITINGALGGTSALQSDLTSYLQGETILLTGFLSNTYPSGVVVLVDSNGDIKTNTTITPGSSQVIDYNILYTDSIGTWTASLQDNTNTPLVNITLYVGVSAPTATTTPGASTATTVATPCQADSVLGIGNCVSEVVVGKMTDENGVVSDVQIQKKGNESFGFIVMIVFTILIVGTYKTFKK